MLQLIHKRRMDSLELQIKNNNQILSKMKKFWAGTDLNEDPEGIEPDMSNQLLERNSIIQQYERNVFKLFKNNQISAQRFIRRAFPESEYSEFNDIFPELLEIYSNQPSEQMNTYAIYERAVRLVQNNRPIPAIQHPTTKERTRKRPSIPLSKPVKFKKPTIDPFEYQSPENSISPFHTNPDKKDKVKCYRCGSTVKINNYPKHIKSIKHLIAEAVIVNSINQEHAERQNYLKEKRDIAESNYDIDNDIDFEGDY